MKAVLKEALEECLVQEEVATNPGEKRCYGSIAKFIRALRYLEQLPEDFPFSPIVLDRGTLLFTTRSVLALRRLRKALREVFGTWEDKLGQIWGTGFEKQMIASYNSPLGIELWLYFDVDDVPEGLLKAGCHIQKETFVEEEYSVVCEVPKE